MRTILILALLFLPSVVDAKTRCRDAKTGAFVSQSYAKHYPGLTTCSKVK
jgi:hypothetical protein